MASPCLKGLNHSSSSEFHEIMAKGPTSISPDPYVHIRFFDLTRCQKPVQIPQLGQYKKSAHRRSRVNLYHPRESNRFILLCCSVKLGYAEAQRCCSKSLGRGFDIPLYRTQYLLPLHRDFRHLSLGPLMTDLLPASDNDPQAGSLSLLRQFDCGDDRMA